MTKKEIIEVLTKNTLYQTIDLDNQFSITWKSRKEFDDRIDQLSNPGEVLASGKVHYEINAGHSTYYMDTKDNGLQEVWRIIEDKLDKFIGKCIIIKIEVVE